MDLELNYKNFIHSHQDKRGTLKKIFNHKIFSRSFDMKKIYQVNLSYNPKKGTIRGLHFQMSKYSESKIVYCLSGKIIDVIVDLRSNSKNIYKCYKKILTSKKNDFMFVPKGFAHGFQVLEKNTNLLYFHDKPYSINSSQTINPFDPYLKIKWPLNVTEISKNDLNADFIKNV